MSENHEINPHTFSTTKPQDIKEQDIKEGVGIKNEEANQETEEIELLPDEEMGLPDLQEKIKKIKEGFNRCETERKEYLDGWQRSKADHINYKNEEGKRFEDMARFVTTGLIQEILPVLDSFDLAVVHELPKELEKGILLIRSQFEDVLKKRGLAEIKVKVGEKFNPEKHEAIGEVESDAPEETIAEEVQRGYFFRERVLRPTRVRLSKKKPAVGAG